MLYENNSIRDNDIAKLFMTQTKRPNERNRGREIQLQLTEEDKRFGNILEYLRERANECNQFETAKIIGLTIGKLKRQFAKRGIMPMFSSDAGAKQIEMRLPRETRFTVNAFLNAIERGASDVDAILTHRGY